MLGNAKNNVITDEQIIELYKEGISQKDISVMYSISTTRTRQVLKKAGFSTDSYRSMNDDIKRYIIGFINDGCSYSNIENRCDISFHAIREIVERNNLYGISAKARAEKTDMPVFSLTEEYIPFLEEYCAGCSFAFLCKKYRFDLNQAIYAFNLITKSDIEQHRENLKYKISSLYTKGLSAASIARNLHISPAIVRKTLI